MIFSAALLSAFLGLASSQACPSFGGLRNPDIPNPSIFLAATNAFYADNVYQFALNLAPASSSNVVVVPTVNNSRLTTRPAALTFTPTNFATPQVVEIIATGSDMTPIIGQSPLSLTFTSTNQNYANTTCIPVNSVRSVSIPLTLNTKTRGGAPLVPPASSGCANSFGSVLNPALPSPFAWVSPNSTTYIDNVFRFDVNYVLTQSVTFTVSTNSPVIVSNVSSITVTPAQASGNTAFPVAVTIAPGTPTTSLAFPYNTTLSFTPQGQSFSLPPVSFNFAFNGETMDIGCDANINPRCLD